MNRSPLAWLMAFALTSGATAQNLPTPVYELPGDDGSPFTYFLLQEGTEYADSAQLAGTERFLQDATLTIYSNIERTATVTFSIYGTAPADFTFPPGTPVGQPGVPPGPMSDLKPLDLPIYTSGPQVVSFEGSRPSLPNLNELVFSGINTLVPDQIFWAVQFDNISEYDTQDAFGPLLENAANLGPDGAATDPSRLYSRSPDFFGGQWLPTWLNTPAPPTSTLSLQLTAIPEPSTLTLVTLASAALLRRRRAA